MRNIVVLPPIKIARKYVEDLDELVAKGYFRSRSDAVRDAVKSLILTIRREAAIDTAVEGIRKVRGEMWADALNKACGDEKKARLIFMEKYIIKEA